jgi:hypothetical protein
LRLSELGEQAMHEAGKPARQTASKPRHVAN